MTSITRNFARALSAFCVVLILPLSANAQPCCSASSAGEAGVVGRCHYAMISTSIGLEHGLGFNDRDGAFQRYESTGSSDMVLTLAGGIRPFDRRFRVGAAMPLRGQYRSAGSDLSSTALRPGDLGLSTGFYVLEDPITGLDSPIPFVEPYLAATLSTGVSSHSASDPLGADTTSTGSSTLGGGLKIIKFVTPAHAVRVSGEYRYSFAHDVESRDSSVEIKPGAAWDLELGWTYEGSIFWSVGVQTRLTLQGRLEQSEQPVDKSEMRRLYTGLTYRRSLSFPYWDLTVGVGQDMLFGKNTVRSGVTAVLGVQRNFL